MVYDVFHSSLNDIMDYTIIKIIEEGRCGIVYICEKNKEKLFLGIACLFYANIDKVRFR